MSLKVPSNPNSMADALGRNNLPLHPPWAVVCAGDFWEFKFLRSYKLYTGCSTGQFVVTDIPHKPEIVFVLFIVIVVGKLIEVGSAISFTLFEVYLFKK